VNDANEGRPGMGERVRGCRAVVVLVVCDCWSGEGEGSLGAKLFVGSTKRVPGGGSKDLASSRTDKALDLLVGGCMVGYCTAMSILLDVVLLSMPIMLQGVCSKRERQRGVAPRSLGVLYLDWTLKIESLALKLSF